MASLKQKQWSERPCLINQNKSFKDAIRQPPDCIFSGISGQFMNRPYVLSLRGSPTRRGDAAIYFIGRLFGILSEFPDVQRFCYKQDWD